MKGDFSRRTFDEADNYSAVLIEQGRMLTDADLEEEHRILAYRIEREAADLIGGCGGPIGSAGFALEDDGALGLTIGAGRYYVDGILAENHETIDYLQQLDVVFGENGETKLEERPPGRYVAYLDVWRRLITALDDPTIREVALGGPTTSVRECVVWQVDLIKTGGNATCLSEFPALETTTGQMAARTNPVTTTDDPCLVPTTAGFKGLENQFYRVEIHDKGQPYDLSTAANSFDVQIPAGTTDRVEVADGAWQPGEVVELYRSGAGFDPLEADLFVIAEVDESGPLPVLKLNRNHQAYEAGDAPRIRKVEATFVWSRDNGSVVTTINSVAGSEITLDDLGPDDVRGFHAGQWVEILDEARELHGLPGGLAWVEEVDPDQRIVRLTADVATVAPWLNLNEVPKLRRWDGAGAIRFQNPAPGDDWIALEDGIQVRFATGDVVTADFRTADYWHFAARAASLDPDSGDIDWPEETGIPKLLPPYGITHHVCPLAIVDLLDTNQDDETDKVSVVADCRNLFPPVTELTTLLYVGGDGQEGTPNPTKPNSLINLGAPLEVRVANGKHPVIGAKVRFTIVKGSGKLQTTDPVETTSPDGIASNVWRLDGKMQLQQVDAELVDAAEEPVPGQVVHFHARLSRASEVAYNPKDCPDLAAAGAITVQQAIDELCKRESGGGGCCVVVGPGREYERIDEAVATLLEQGKNDLCLCLLPGLYDLPGWSVVNDDPTRRVNLSIKGCGPSTRIDLRDNGIIRGLWSFVLREVDFAARQHSWLEIDQVHDARLDTCRITGVRDEGALIELRNATNVYVGNSVFEAQGGVSFDDVIEVLKFDVFPELADLFAVADWRDFEGFSREVAVRLVGLPQNVREELWREILRRINRLHLDPLSMEVENACRRLAFALVLEDRDPFALIDHLIAIREEAIRSQPGMALEIGWTMKSAPNPDLNGVAPSLRDPGRTRAGEIVVENNVIIGGLSLYGPGQDPWPTTEIQQTLERLERILDPPGNQTGPVLFNGHLGVAHLRNNHLTRVLVAQEVTRALIELVQSGGEAMLETIFKSLHVTDNVIDGSPNVFVAEHVALTSNNFTLDAMRSLEFDDDVGQRVETVVVIGDTGIYTGNQGRGTVPLIQTALRDVTRARAAAANLELIVV